MDLDALDILQYLDISKEGNPDENYTKVIKIITDSRGKYMPTKFEKLKNINIKNIAGSQVE